MLFATPSPGPSFEIPDDWWAFTDMDGFAAGGGGYYPPNPEANFTVVDIAEVEPPTRSEGVALFKKYKLVPVLFAFQSPQCALPPVEVVLLGGERPYRFKVRNGVHRYYASVAAGYSRLAVEIMEVADYAAQLEALGF